MPVQPVLVAMSYRGGGRWERCLRSIEAAEGRFSRIVLSVTAEAGSPDVLAAEAFAAASRARGRSVDVVCTGRELPTMEHQARWVDHLEQVGLPPSTWIMWLAYDDEVRARGIDAIVDARGNWPLEPCVAYLGPWAMRHEHPESLWDGDASAPLEAWTAFPVEGPVRASVPEWVADQLIQPTYLQMSGALLPFSSFLELRDGLPRKRGPMRIEMAAVATSANGFVAELPEPVTIVYGRANSDRASYGSAARREDIHLAGWLARYGLHRPRALPGLIRAGVRTAGHLTTVATGRRPVPSEAWNVRGSVMP